LLLGGAQGIYQTHSGRVRGRALHGGVLQS
jgi:hypothetical protein